MRFCTHCGAQVPDNSKFCTACGTPIDAPDEATVVISDPEEEVVEASDVEGEFTAASWSPEPAAQPEKQPKSQARPAAEPQPQPQPKPQSTAAPAEQKKGFFHYLWLYIKIILLVVAIVFAALFIKGLFTDKPDEPVLGDVVYETPRASRASAEEDDGFQSLDDLSASEREEYEKALLARTDKGSAQNKSAKVTVGTVKFLLAGDYKIASRERLQNGEGCTIVPKNATNRNNCLKLVVIPNALADIGGLTSEELHNMLAGAVEEVAEEYTGGRYNIQYEDNADGKYFPHCYSFLNLKNSKTGKLTYTYTEATLVSGNLLSGCAVAADEANLAALMDIYSAVVAGAFL